MKTATHKKFLCLTIALLALASTMTARAQNSAARVILKALDAQVLDAETKEPLEGVVVVVSWTLLDATKSPSPNCTLRRQLPTGPDASRFPLRDPDLCRLRQSLTRAHRGSCSSRTATNTASWPIR
jgi:hypothetical protein